MKLGDIMKRNLLISRMNAIGDVIRQMDHTLAVLALGSIGVDIDRLDAYSDLDFFVIVEDHYKNHLIENLEWLERVSPIGFCFRNTKDGYKVIFKDGIYAEFAVFSRSEVKGVVQNQARLIWKKEGYEDETLLIKKNSKTEETHNPKDLLYEALTNLYVGLNRALRGEKLSGQRFIEGYALDHIIQYMRILFKTDEKDIFSPERRFEMHYPEIQIVLSKMLSGYNHLHVSAESILTWINSEIKIDTFLYHILEELTQELKHKESINE